MSENQASPTISIEDQIQAAILKAHEICDRLGAQSRTCTLAWDGVEELQAEASN